MTVREGFVFEAKVTVVPAICFHNPVSPIAGAFALRMVFVAAQRELSLPAFAAVKDLQQL